MDENDVNPFAPPSSLPHAPREEWRQGAIWKDGGKLIVGPFAELPARCFVTGQDTQTSVTIRTRWQPSWVYIFLLTGILPYLIISPIVSREAVLKVPVAAEILRVRRSRSRILVASAVLFVLAAVLIIGFPPRAELTALLLVSFGSLAAILFWFASCDPVQLHVVQLQKSILVLKKVHPRCLENVPDLPRGHSI